MRERSLERCWILPLALMLAVPAGRLNASDTAEEVLEKLRQKFNTIEDAELTFSETDRFTLTTMEHHVAGTLIMKKGNRYRVAMEGDTIVTDGETVWHYSAATRQVLIDHFKMDERSLSPERILAAAPGDYEAALLGREKVGKNETEVLKLIPQAAHSSLKAMKLWVDDKEWFVRKAELEDVGGKRTSYVVQEAKFNTGVPDSLFSYQIPAGAEVVDLR